jgi:hypothetical protein
MPEKAARHTGFVVIKSRAIDSQLLAMRIEMKRRFGPVKATGPEVTID